MKKISQLKDGAAFRFNNRKGAAVYELNTIEKGKAICTSVKSGRTYRFAKSRKVFQLD